MGPASLGGATTASLVVAIAAMLAITRPTGEPVTVAMFGAVVAMQSSAAVKDRDQRRRNITTLLMSLPSLGAVTLAAAAKRRHRGASRCRWGRGRTCVTGSEGCCGDCRSAIGRHTRLRGQVS
ncbi:hypothetical protein [Mycobacterium sp. 1274761.0]|uniref:hypothetical protein n=1 Tax=Mycobacterium sp. 1274761.0 TaxID=1834077 RepID=UPI0007FC317A|nr:hypothetical protein [Mycobacterium sp. 1274761.0]OBK70656.1 hypothetical protein A5651_20620 [Mycobacterium sp. 1274761.0]